MRQLLPGLAAAILLVPAVPVRAQQGSVQVSTSAQAVTGDAQRLAGQNRLDPDVGISWLQPGTRFGIFQIEVRGARRGDEAHLGRAYVAIRDVKLRGVAWSFEGGDTFFSPAVGDYRIANLFTPAVTFTGGAVTGRTTHSNLQVVVGRASAWRNIFGTDPETLAQDIGTARATHKFGDWLEVGARASRIRTRSLKEFSFSIDASDQAGGGAKVWVTPELQLVADASVVSFRRAGASAYERDVSYIAGASWLHKRGWFQANASHFAAGDFPVLNYPLQDREGLFVAGDYDLFPRLRVSAGWEAFRSNVNPDASLAALRPAPRSTGTREFGGLRLQLTSRSSVTVRGEQGDRRSRPIRSGSIQDSDTGSWTAEWQTAVGRFNSFARYARRENVDQVNAVSSYTQHDSSAQLFMNVSRSTQLFGTVMFMRNEVRGAGTTYWQAGGGAQLQVPHRDLWIRGEGTMARNVDLLTQSFVPRESITAGLNGQLTRRLSIAFNVHVDRSPMPLQSGSPWMTRSMVRLVRTLPTGSVYSANNAALNASSSGRGTGSVVGSVFADWNGNGVFDTGENPLEGIPLRIAAGTATNSGHDGQFSFLNVPVGLRDVGLDTGALPVDFDPPTVTSVQMEISRGDTRRIAFGLIPLGTIEGRVIRDANANGKADPGEEPIDGAVVILDEGARSEQVRRGRYRFDAVRSGDHTVKLLLESLPEGAVIAGSAEVKTSLVRDRLLADIPFVVSVTKRPEIRKVFPPKGGTTASRARTTPAPPSRTAPETGVSSRPPATAPGTPAAVKVSTRRVAMLYAVQVAALSDIDNAREFVIRLTVAGLPAYLVEPAPGESLYRVRVGTYRTRDAARKAAGDLERLMGVKLWVMRDR